MAFRWTGIGMLPLDPRAAEKAFEIGRVYRLEPWMDRSPASAAHYFAAVNDAFDKLPPHLAERFPSPNHLRKYALCITGHCDQRSIECRSHAEALRVAAFLRPIDEYAVVNVSASTVVMLTARSQSARAMDRQTFAASKDAVLGYIASLVEPIAAPSVAA
jgi:hypothetical protein